MLRLGVLSLLVLTTTVVSARAQGVPQMAGCDPDKWNVGSADLRNLSTTHTILIKDVHIDCNDIQLFADEAELFSDVDRLQARGNVVFVSPGNRISADHLEFNTRTKTGTFFAAYGIASVADRGIDRSFFGSQEPDAYFWGDTIEKLGPKTYKITHGGFTTCVQPTPRWQLVTSAAVVTLEKHAVLKNTVLKVKDVPLFYLPAMYYPINKEDRATGFLIPTYGASTIRGRTISNAFFWAISRSQDATFYHDWFSKTGMGYGGEYRRVSNGGTADFRTYMLREHATEYELSDGSLAPYDGTQSYQLQGTLTQQINKHLRAAINANYFSSLAIQQRYQQDIYNATNRSRSMGANLQGAWGANNVSFTADRSETFTSNTTSSVYGSAPRLLYSRSEKRIGELPIYFGGTAEYRQLITVANLPSRVIDTGLTRIDFLPTVRFPFTRWPFLTFSSALGYHDTWWSESLVDGKQTDTPVTRRFFDMSTRVTGPTFARVWSRPGKLSATKFKHVIEPTFSIRRATAFETGPQIVKNDSTDYAVGGYTRINYALNSRLYAKKQVAREIVSFSVDQSYYTDKTASLVDTSYQSSYFSSAPSNFSPLTYQVRVSPTQNINGSMRAEWDTQLHALQLFSVTGGATLLPLVQASAGWSHRKNSRYGVNDPNRRDNFLTADTTVSSRGGAIHTYYQFNYDLQRQVFVQQRIAAAYNSQCCGIAAEYQSFNYAIGGFAGLGIPQDRRFNLSFTLAGIGSFSNLLGSFGGQQRR
jgi:LPS-assembly protein